MYGCRDATLRVSPLNGVVRAGDAKGRVSTSFDQIEYTNLKTAVNTPETDAGEWQVQRLTITGRRLLWQTLGQDTLRLLALDAATVRRQPRSGAATFRLAPAAGQQTRRVGSYAGLWETADEFARRH